MDTSNLGSQEKQHLEIYKGFMGFMRNSAILVAIILILMAYFLL
ncbi:MAG: aa3-type cytochrome c oxidase subunit IV [Pseudomonadota bacterium]|nr:aa3-type cytochrome c oxidase subunit IV [Pseudomonadota bacterium]